MRIVDTQTHKHTHILHRFRFYFVGQTDGANTHVDTLIDTNNFSQNEKEGNISLRHLGFVCLNRILRGKYNNKYQQAINRSEKCKTFLFSVFFWIRNKLNNRVCARVCVVCEIDYIEI